MFGLNIFIFLLLSGKTSLYFLYVPFELIILFYIPYAFYMEHMHMHAKVYMESIVLVLMNPHTYYSLVMYSRKSEKVLL